MNFRLLGPDRIDEELKSVIEQIAAGKPPRDIESRVVEVKEEPGRRTGHSIVPGSTTNEDAAVYLLDELACMANTPGSGALILGVADDGRVIGTELNAEWLRHRLYELSDSKLTIHVQEAELDGTRLLILRPPESIEPIRSRDRRIRWRVADNCVEVDAATWSQGYMMRLGFDWSDQPSGYRIDDVNLIALEIARDFLKAASNDPNALELASSSDEDLLRRLNLVKPDGHLTNAGALLFIATPEPGLDYIRRDYSGADSSMRVNTKGPLLNQLAAVLNAAAAANRILHVPVGPVHIQLRAIPELAIREAVVNGITHRDWQSAAPTVVEHQADSLVVTSPGGFVSGVNPENILTYPSTPRYRALASAMSALKLAEREGIGVDRMVREMLALGHSLPDIAEIPGPQVRVALVGGVPDKLWMEFLRALAPDTVAQELDLLLLLNLLVQRGWLDVRSAAPVLQKSELETRAAIQRLELASIAEQPVVTLVDGVPDAEPPAWRFSNAARRHLGSKLEHLLNSQNRQSFITDWATHRQRVSSTEVSDLLDLSASHANTILTNLADEGYLVPIRKSRRGRGFYYLPAAE